MNNSRPASPTRHPLAIIVLHWLTVILIFAGVAAVLVRNGVEGRGLRLWLLNQHRSIGLLILTLVALRLLARALHRARMASHGLPRTLALVSSAGHLSLYILLLATPLLGLALTWARGQEASLLGLVQPPHLLGPDPDLADTLASWHQLVAWSLLAVAAAHAAAAVWHHRFRRDGVLRAMLPGPAPDGIRV